MSLGGDLTDLALALFDAHVFRHADGEYETPPFVTLGSNGERGFRLKLHESSPHAPLSPYFLQLRMPDNAGKKKGNLTAELVARIGTMMGDFAWEHGLRFDAVVGLPHAGDPFAKAFPAKHPITGRPFPKLQLHKEEGEQRRIIGPPEGDFKPGQIVLPIDDLATGGHTKLEGIRALEAAPACLRVTDVLVVIDRQEGGAETLRQAGYKLHALLILVDLLGIYVTYKRISTALRGNILRYVER